MSIKVNWTRTALSATLAASLIVMSGCSLLPKEEAPLAPPLVKPVKQNFTTIEVKKTSIEQSVKGAAVLEPYVKSYHQFKDTGGRIKEIFVKSGDVVKKGDPLIQLEVEGLDMDIKYKALEVEKAKAGLEEARSKQDQSLMRIKMLELDIAQTNYDRTYEKLNSRQLVAEMDGIVTYVTDLEPPDFVEPYQNLVVVSDTRKLHLLLEKSDTNAFSGVEVGMDGEAEWNDTVIPVKVTQTPRSAPSTDDDQLREKYARAIYMDIEDLPEDAELGDSMDIKIITKKKDETLVIPTQALRTFMTRNYVQILDGERISEADVEIGIKTSTEVEILAGVEEGQQLILR